MQGQSLHEVIFDYVKYSHGTAILIAFACIFSEYRENQLKKDVFHDYVDKSVKIPILTIYGKDTGSI